MSDRREKIEALLRSPIEGERKAAEAALGRLRTDKRGEVLAPSSDEKPTHASPEWHAAIQEWCRKLEFCVSRLGSPLLSKAEVVLIRNWSRGRGDPWAPGAEQIKAVHRKLMAADGQPVEALTDQVGDFRVG